MGATLAAQVCFGSSEEEGAGEGVTTTRRGEGSSKEHAHTQVRRTYPGSYALCTVSCVMHPLRHTTMAVHSTTPYSTQSATHILAIALSQAAKAKSTQSIKSSAASLQPTADGRSRPCCPPEQPTLRSHAVLLDTFFVCLSISGPVKLSPCRSRRPSSPQYHRCTHIRRPATPGHDGEIRFCPARPFKIPSLLHHPSCLCQRGQLLRKSNPIGLARHNVVKPLLLPLDGQQSSHVA